MTRSVWSDPVDEQAALVDALSQRVIALERRLSRLEPGEWIVVGSGVGIAPAFGSNVTNFGGGNVVARFRRELGDVIRVEGIVKTIAATGVEPVRLWVMPTGYIPSSAVQTRQRLNPDNVAGQGYVNIGSTGALDAFFLGSGNAVTANQTVSMTFTYTVPS